MPVQRWMGITLQKLVSSIVALALILAGLVVLSTVSATPAKADVSAPSWWSGACDVNNHPGSYPLGASFNGVQACGPGSYNQGGTDQLVHFFPAVAGQHAAAWGEYEWECVELVMRYMYQVYGIPPYSAPGGKDVVANYPGTGTTVLTKVNNDGTSLPSPGDIISIGAAPVNPTTGVSPNSYGHTAVVTSVSVNASGSGSLTDMQQNATANGVGTLTISGGKVTGTVLGGAVTGWLHNPNGSSATNSTGPAPVVASLVTSDGVRHVYSGTSTGGLYETWWSASSPSPTTWQLTNVGSAVTGISAQVTSDGNEHVYYGTAGGEVGEVWWGANSNGVHLGQSYNTGAYVTAISSQVTSDGIQHIYSANAAGSLYETWWGSSPAVTTQIANVGVSVVSISSQVTSDGTEHIFYGATNGQVGEVWWNATSNGGHLGFTSNVGTNVTAVSSQITSDGVRHIYSAAADGGLYETWWGYSSTSATTWQIANVGQHPTSISSQVTSDGTEHVYYGTSFGQVGEVWWNATSNGVHLGQTYNDPAGVADTSVSSLVTPDGSQNVFFGNAAGSLFGMSWGANPATTASLGSVG